jgi:Xaa-Pro aminopeptidase
MFDLEKIQKALKEFQLDGWILYDFRQSNILAHRVLNIPTDLTITRRFCYCIPAEGSPKKLMHQIEPDTLSHLPGETRSYLRWQEWEKGIEWLVDGMKTVASEYSPFNANPYISKLDAGLADLLKRFHLEIVPSGDLIQLFEAVWTEEQWLSHKKAEVITTKSFDLAWEMISKEIQSNNNLEELAVQKMILDHFAANNMITDHPPIVARGENSGNPHYETGTGENTLIKKGELVLIDLWGKLDEPNAVFSDLTRMGYVGNKSPEKEEAVFQIVASARDAAINKIEISLSNNQSIQGWEVDQAARDVIDQAGFGSYFVHRTGHSIGQETHGNGANMDNLETREERHLLPSTCFSIEPGIYLPEFGIRSEVNVFIDKNNHIHVTGGPVQKKIELIFNR